MFKEFFEYGEKVPGYEIRVLNEREARAAAGILFALGILSLLNAVMLGHGMVTRFFIGFFTLDFVIRVIQPRYAPSLLLGRLFVQNQTPEYVGAIQKRFAWSIGLLLALPMFYTVTLHFIPTLSKVFICILCLVLLFLESSFSICVGCKIYEYIFKKSAKYCPGGVCEIKKKEPIQTFNTAQKIIVAITIGALVVGSYFYFTKLENRSVIGKRVKMLFMSDAEKKALEEQKQREIEEEFENDDDF